MSIALEKPIEFKKPKISDEDNILLGRIRDLWANGVSDYDIRNVLGISSSKWTALMKKLKESTAMDHDNHIAYQRHIAKISKRSKDLETIRNHAMSLSEIGNAVKCMILENQIDNETLLLGQKLGVLENEVIRIEKTVKNENSVEILFKELPATKKIEAENDLKELTRLVLSEGIVLSGNAENTDPEE